MISTVPSTAATISQMIQVPIAALRKRNDLQLETRPVRPAAHLHRHCRCAGRSASASSAGPSRRQPAWPRRRVRRRWTAGRTSSQIGRYIPGLDHARGRGTNHTWKCAPPSPQRYRWTRPTSPSDRIALSTRPATRPKSAAWLGGHVGERVEVLPACEPHRARQAAANRRVQGPQVVVPQRGRHVALADPARLPARLTAPRWFRYHPLARRSWCQRFLIWHGHDGYSLCRSVLADYDAMAAARATPKAAAGHPMSRACQFTADFTRPGGNGDIDLIRNRRPVMPAASHLSYSHGASAEPLLGETIGDNLHRIAAAHAAREALVDVPTGRAGPTRSWTPTATRSRSGLIAAGIGKGDRVGIWAPNCAEWALLQYGLGQGGRDPGQHQPGLPQPRARLRAAPVRHPGCWSAPRASRPATTAP